MYALASYRVCQVDLYGSREEVDVANNALGILSRLPHRDFILPPAFVYSGESFCAKLHTTRVLPYYHNYDMKI